MQRQLPYERRADVAERAGNDDFHEFSFRNATKSA
jgi:hypothetical protein